MNYYVRQVEGGQPQLWQISGDSATQLGVTNPHEGVGTFFKSVDGADVWEVMRRSTPWFGAGNPFHRLDLQAGTFHPRMARPLALASAHAMSSRGWNPGDNSRALSSARSQLEVLTSDLVRICRTIHPEGSNLDAFGHDIRNLLILACTEVELAWRGVLQDNAYPGGRWTTSDYVKLGELLRLGEYAVVFPAYPWLEGVKPFEGWSTDAPTRTLPWYDAYNAVKHDRDDNFGRASLRNAFLAVSACAITLAAQFGVDYGLGTQTMSNPGTSLSVFYSFTSVPQWSENELYYHLPGSASPWIAVKHPGLQGPG